MNFSAQRNLFILFLLRIKLGGEKLIFIMLVKNKVKPTKEVIAKANSIEERMKKEGVKILKHYWTLGKYDDVIIFEAPDEKAAMKLGIIASDLAMTETLVAIPRKEALSLLE